MPDRQLSPSQRRFAGAIANFLTVLAAIQDEIAADVQAEGIDPAEPEIRARLQAVAGVVRDGLDPADRDRFDRMLDTLHAQLNAHVAG